jgi:hypothetical protein
LIVFQHVSMMWRVREREETEREVMKTTGRTQREI